MAQEQLTRSGEKLSWKLNGDLTDNAEKVVRIRGRQYVIPNYRRTDISSSQYDIEFIDGPHQGLRLSAQLIYHGEIEQDYKDLLPDNAISHGTPDKE